MMSPGSLLLGMSTDFVGDGKLVSLVELRLDCPVWFMGSG